MLVSDIMVAEVASLSPEDTVAKALNLMIDRSINQVPLVNGDGRYAGMVFAKQLLASSAQTASKLQKYAVSTSALGPDDDVEKAARLVVGSGNRALPVVQGGRLLGIVSETDIAQTADFGHAIVDEVMSGAIVIEEGKPLAEAMSKMRRYNISRLPVINEKGVLRGIVSILDASVSGGDPDRAHEQVCGHDRQQVEGPRRRDGPGADAPRGIGRAGHAHEHACRSFQAQRRNYSRGRRPADGHSHIQGRAGADTAEKGRPGHPHGAS
ncbi:CBS domain-containing protein [Candidatus Nitrososphaera sp. FF02]|uniref:CBS domain-containing protein n=1 Tax=Candidatus Nitrososphaera sp. FF02 TaxID=3398226 RepID=UPI0039EA485C